MLKYCGGNDSGEIWNKGSASEERLQGDGGSAVAAYQEGQRLCGSDDRSDKAEICVGRSVELTQRSEWDK